MQKPQIVDTGQEGVRSFRAKFTPAQAMALFTEAKFQRYREGPARIARGTRTHDGLTCAVIMHDGDEVCLMAVNLEGDVVETTFRLFQVSR